MHAIPLLHPGKRQRCRFFGGAPSRSITEPLAERLDPCRGFAEVESRAGEPMRHSRHAMGDDVRKRGMASESERKAEPPVADPEQDGGGQPVRLAESIAPVVEEVHAVAAQEEQRQGVGKSRIVPVEELTGRGVGEPGQGFERVMELPGPRLKSRVEAIHRLRKIVQHHGLCVPGTLFLSPFHQTLDRFPEEPRLESSP